MTAGRKEHFYHGTRHPLREGDVITPAGAAKFANYAETDPSYVHVSTNNAHAYRFAGMASEMQAQHRGSAMGLPANTSYGPKTYRVEPLGHVEPDEDAGLDFEGAEETSFRSQHGFRVLGRQW